MTLELSREDIKAIGQMWGTSLFTPEELDEVLSNTSLEVRLRGLKPEDRLADLKPEQLEEIEAYIKQQKQQSI
ncbi:hypothetical protein PN36_05115 [Candidatus Thiomargarita nelsonii]|uniref:Uncharacterized protein n=1 Tax=Candidatus Thiomargarita nelsonii TaxID=1003181 RepID=A0A0A6PAU9_9GAMM|nr:hypothetical protein PN36_05115 [Candidatus Thiomargarita nelsonii]